MTSTGGQTPYTGGIVGHVSYEVQILDCYSTGTITSSSNRTEEAWGIAGGISGTIITELVVKTVMQPVIFRFLCPTQPTLVVKYGQEELLDMV